MSTCNCIENLMVIMYWSHSLLANLKVEGTIVTYEYTMQLIMTSMPSLPVSNVIRMWAHSYVVICTSSLHVLVIMDVTSQRRLVLHCLLVAVSCNENSNHYSDHISQQEYSSWYNAS